MLGQQAHRQQQCGERRPRRTIRPAQMHRQPTRNARQRQHVGIVHAEIVGGKAGEQQQAGGEREAGIHPRAAGLSHHRAARQRYRRQRRKRQQPAGQHRVARQFAQRADDIEGQRRVIVEQQRRIAGIERLAGNRALLKPGIPALVIVDLKGVESADQRIGCQYECQPQKHLDCIGKRPGRERRTVRISAHAARAVTI